MRLPRMTTRRWMVAVAVIALVLGGIVGGVRLKRRRDDFLSRVQHHEERESYCKAREQLYHALAENFAPARERMREGDSSGPTELSKMEYRVTIALKARERANHASAYHAAMAQKYRDAARYPWLSVEPDPPEPPDPDRIPSS